MKNLKDKLWKKVYWQVDAQIFEQGYGQSNKQGYTAIFDKILRQVGRQVRGRFDWNMQDSFDDEGQ